MCCQSCQRRNSPTDLSHSTYRLSLSFRAHLRPAAASREWPLYRLSPPSVRARGPNDGWKTSSRTGRPSAHALERGPAPGLPRGGLHRTARLRHSNWRGCPITLSPPSPQELPGCMQESPLRPSQPGIHYIAITKGFTADGAHSSLTSQTVLPFCLVPNIHCPFPPRQLSELGG